jgi:Ni,Fe-hydrogenase III small subunit
VEFKTYAIIEIYGILMAGGVTTDHLKLEIDTGGCDNCEIAVIVYTDKERPDIESVEKPKPEEPRWFDFLFDACVVL